MADDIVHTHQAYCFKCRTKREMETPQAIYNKAGAPATRGECPECGTTMYRVGRTPAHEGIPKPEVAKRPARKKAKPKAKRKKRVKSNGRNPGKRAKIGRLVIVESPAKARSIGGFLGKGYTVLSSVGHVRDLLKSRLSVDIENNFEPEYRVPNEKRAVVKELKAAAEAAEEIYLATDPDREGEAIAWHLVAAAEMPADQVQRVVFHEITDGAVAEAFANPRTINADLVNAQQARRILDRLVGYQVSQLLWSKVRNGLSAGRVQSIALRLVVEREDEIAAFKPREYWTIDAALAKQGQSGDSGRFTASLVQINDIRVTFDPQERRPRPSLIVKLPFNRILKRCAKACFRWMRSSAEHGRVNRRRPLPQAPCSKPPPIAAASARAEPCALRSSSTRALILARAVQSASSPICVRTAFKYPRTPSHKRADS